MIPKRSIEAVWSNKRIQVIFLHEVKAYRKYDLFALYLKKFVLPCEKYKFII